jgi:hypothetical protein
VRRSPRGSRTVSALTVLMVVAMADPAMAGWTTSGAGTGQGDATTVATAAGASADVFNQTATVTWAASGLVGTSEVATGYSVERVWRGEDPGPQGQVDGDSEPATGGCAGTVTALTCASPHASGETWSYRVIPHYAAWTGPAGDESAPLRMAAAPTVTSVALVNVGTINVVNSNDRIELTFSEELDPTSVCSGFDPSATGTQTATGMTFFFANANAQSQNVISVTAGGTCGTSGFGELQVGGTAGGRYTQGSGTFSVEGSTLSWDPATRRITVTFGTIVGRTSAGTAADAIYSPGALTADGLPIGVGPYTFPNQGF